MNTSPSTPVATALADTVALAVFSALLPQHGGLTPSASTAERLAVASWDYADAWMKVRGRRASATRPADPPPTVILSPEELARARESLARIGRGEGGAT